jgi:hypothetical protein
MTHRVNDRLLREVFPARADDPDFVAALDQSTYDNVVAILEVLAGRLRVADADPQGAYALMEIFAHLGEPTSLVERGYRIGQWEIWEQWLLAAQARAAGDAALLAILLEGPARALFRYIDGMLGTVLERYESQRRDQVRALDHHRTAVIRAILDGSFAESPVRARTVLGYDCELTHRAVALATPDRRDAAREADRLGEALHGAQRLLHQDSVNGWVVWFAGHGVATPDTLRAFRRTLEDVELATGVSDPQPGVPGLRSTLAQARQALRIGDALGRPSTWFDDVRLEALLLEDPDRATGFGGAVLGALGAPDARSAALRATLAIWLETGSHVATAATMGLHEHTVRKRLGRVEDLLGRPPTSRRTELAVALRLHRVLHPAR